MVWLGSMHHRKDTKLQMSSEPDYVLGVHFTYDLEAFENFFFFDKLGPLKKTLNIWSHRYHSIVGRMINIL